jgi:hypothetical protein
MLRPESAGDADFGGTREISLFLPCKVAMCIEHSAGGVQAVSKHALW